MGQDNVYLLQRDVVNFGGPLPNYSLNVGASIRVEAWRVEIYGEVSSGGNDVQIIAHEVAFKTPDALIDTSGQAAQHNFPPGVKPPTPPDGARGMRGANGSDGVFGAKGTSAANVTIYANLISGSLKIRARGGDGGRAQDGGDGSNGGLAPPQRMEDGCGISGFPGAKGGDAGKAGNPGSAGNGGNVDLYLGPAYNNDSPRLKDVSLDLKGGAAAPPASNGNPGRGGQGGFAPGCLQHPHQPAAGHPGPPGRDGAIAPAPPPSSPSIDGKFCGKDAGTTPPPYNSVGFDQLAKQCSAQQLWSVLQEGEQFYINDNLLEAAPRLRWVSILGRLVGATGGVE